MFDSWRRWRDQSILKRRPIPEAMWEATLRHFPFLAQLSAHDGQRLRELATLFLARKEFSGAHGLAVTDEMAVAIAAQACLPILQLGLSWYDGFVGIVVHADEVVARREVMDEDGVVHHYDEPLAGEAMEGGPVTLSWRDVADAGTSAEWGYNVIVHEFAHVLDMRDGEADGVPPLPSRAARDEWQAVLEAEYQLFCEQVDAEADTLLDPYGAEAPGEFFAVACEAFFVSPLDLQAEHGELYRLLSGFFRQDPALRA
jgi:MtfA peptidase